MAVAGARVFPRPLIGDVEEAVHEVHAAAIGVAPGGALVFGGKTSVMPDHANSPAEAGELRQTIAENGPNQELALRFAILARERRLPGPWVFLSTATGGRDGASGATGGLVDSGSIDRLRATGIDWTAAVERHDCHSALACCEGLFATGPTGTNVADLAVFLRG
jgi:hydroxypyruvate reductase